MSYSLIIHPKALKEIQQLSRQDIQRVEKAIDKLQHNSRPHGYIKMSDYASDRAQGEDCYRIRVGGNRIIYTIQDQVVTVTVIQVKKRGDIY